jgi:hypothetical protein
MHFLFRGITQHSALVPFHVTSISTAIAAVPFYREWGTHFLLQCTAVRFPLARRRATLFIAHRSIAGETGCYILNASVYIAFTASIFAIHLFF